MEKKKRRWGDRKDGVLLRDLDGMHFITPLIYPNRCDNEAYIRETIDLTNMNAYLKKKNESETEFPYTMFHIIVAGLVKTITLRPKMNRFIANKNFYQRNEVSMSFVVKKQFADEAAEALAVIHAKDESNVESIHEDLRHQILDCKDVHKVDSSTDNMDFFNHMPRFLGKFLVWILTRLDIHGWIPASIIETDPYYTTCVISNLGSIKLNCGYHHLTNWGTCSVFCIIGEKSKRPVYHEDGTIEMREMLDLGLTIDERLADGYYYSKTIRLLKTLLENPELLDTQRAFLIQMHDWAANGFHALRYFHAKIAAPRKIRNGDHAGQLSILRDRQSAQLRAGHEARGLCRILPCLDGQNACGHDLTHTHLLCRFPCRDAAQHNVAICQNPAEPPIFPLNRQKAEVIPAHEPRCNGNRLLCTDADDINAAGASAFMEIVAGTAGC